MRRVKFPRTRRDRYKDRRRKPSHLPDVGDVEPRKTNIYNPRKLRFSTIQNQPEETGKYTLDKYLAYAPAYQPDHGQPANNQAIFPAESQMPLATNAESWANLALGTSTPRNLTLGSANGSVTSLSASQTGGLEGTTFVLPGRKPEVEEDDEEDDEVFVANPMDKWRGEYTESFPSMDTVDLGSQTGGATGVDLFYAVFGIFTYLLDVATDLLLAFQYLALGHYFWFGLTLGFFFVPAVIMSIFSLILYIRDWKIVGERPSMFRWALRSFCMIFLMAPLVRILESTYYLCKSRSAKDVLKRREFYDRWLDEDTDSTLLRLFESFLEAAPQLVLQIYIMSKLGTSEGAPLVLLQVVGLLSSWFTITGTMVMFQKSLRLSQPKKGKLKLPALTCMFFWRLFTIASRVMALGLFAAQFQWAVFAVVGGHWIIMLIWVMLQETDYCRLIGMNGKESNSPCLEFGFRFVTSFVHVFAFFNLIEGHSRLRCITYYAITYVENVAMVMAWYFVASKVATTTWYFIPALLLVILGFWIGIGFQGLFYKCYHPNNISVLHVRNRIRWCIPCSELFMCKEPSDGREPPAVRERVLSQKSEHPLQTSTPAPSMYSYNSPGKQNHPLGTSTPAPSVYSYGSPEKPVQKVQPQPQQTRPPPSQQYVHKQPPRAMQYQSQPGQYQSQPGQFQPPPPGQYQPPPPSQYQPPPPSQYRPPMGPNRPPPGQQQPPPGQYRQPPSQQPPAPSQSRQPPGHQQPPPDQYRPPPGGNRQPMQRQPPPIHHQPPPVQFQQQQPTVQKQQPLRQRPPPQQAPYQPPQTPPLPEQPQTSVSRQSSMNQGPDSHVVFRKPSQRSSVQSNPTETPIREPEYSDKPFVSSAYKPRKPFSPPHQKPPSPIKGLGSLPPRLEAEEPTEEPLPQSARASLAQEPPPEANYVAPSRRRSSGGDTSKSDDLTMSSSGEDLLSQPTLLIVNPPLKQKAPGVVRIKPIKKRTSLPPNKAPPTRLPTRPLSDSKLSLSSHGNDSSSGSSSESESEEELIRPITRSHSVTFGPPPDCPTGRTDEVIADPTKKRPARPITPGGRPRSPRDLPKRSSSPRNPSHGRPRSPRDMSQGRPRSPRDMSQGRPRSPRDMSQGRPRSPRDMSQGRPRSPRDMSQGRPRSPRDMSQGRPRSPRELTARPRSPREISGAPYPQIPTEDRPSLFRPVAQRAAAPVPVHQPSLAYPPPESLPKQPKQRTPHHHQPHPSSSRPQTSSTTRPLPTRQPVQKGAPRSKPSSSKQHRQPKSHQPRGFYPSDDYNPNVQGFHPAMGFNPTQAVPVHTPGRQPVQGHIPGRQPVQGHTPGRQPVQGHTPSRQPIQGFTPDKRALVQTATPRDSDTETTV